MYVDIIKLEYDKVCVGYRIEIGDNLDSNVYDIEKSTDIDNLIKMYEEVDGEVKLKEDLIVASDGKLKTVAEDKGCYDRQCTDISNDTKLRAEVLRNIRGYIANRRESINVTRVVIDDTIGNEYRLGYIVSKLCTIGFVKPNKPVYKYSVANKFYEYCVEIEGVTTIDKVRLKCIYDIDRSATYPFIHKRIDAIKDTVVFDIDKEHPHYKLLCGKYRNRSIKGIKESRNITVKDRGYLEVVDKDTILFIHNVEIILDKPLRSTESNIDSIIRLISL